MTGKPLTPGASLHRLTTTGALPNASVIDPRRGVCDWHSRGLRYRLMLWRDRRSGAPEGLRRQLFVGVSGRLGEPRDRGGLDPWVSIEANAPERDDFDQLAEFARSARAFVVDVSDLCWLLSQEHDVTRGPLRAWLYQGYPARLAMALALARDASDEPRVAQILEVIHSGAQVSVSPVKREDVLTEVRRWARELGREAGIHIRV